jgi:hypothetical protein
MLAPPSIRSALLEILGVRDLDIACAARRQGDSHSGPLGNRRVVGEFPRQPGSAKVSGQDLRKPETLRSLCRKQLAAILGRRDGTVVDRALDRVGHRSDWQRRIVTSQCFDDA